MEDGRGKPGGNLPATGSAGAVDAFLGLARVAARAASTGGARRGKLVFALDATMSRRPTWEAALTLQGGMFEAAAEVGGLDVQLVFFRGLAECRASRWVADARALADLMAGVACRGGLTQIGRVLRHLRAEAGPEGPRAFVYVGDAVEEPVDALCALAGELGLLGLKGFVFQEGRDGQAEAALREIARLTGGAYARFDAGAPATLKGLLRAAAAYAAGGREGLARLAAREDAAVPLLTQLR